MFSFKLALIPVRSLAASVIDEEEAEEAPAPPPAPEAAPDDATTLTERDVAPAAYAAVAAAAVLAAAALSFMALAALRALDAGLSSTRWAPPIFFGFAPCGCCQARDTVTDRREQTCTGDVTLCDIV